MQSLNVLIAGEGKCAGQIKKSKFLNKLYVTSETEIEDTIQIKFNTFKELAKKCKALQVDIVLVENERWILEGIATIMKQNFINCFAVSTDWAELGLSNDFARNMLNKYEINIPPIINFPIEFPVVVKGDGVFKIAESMQEVISIKEDIYKTSGEISRKVFLEKFMKGEKQKIISLFDGKHLITFPQLNINEVLIKEYSKKLEKMFVQEKANFVGFINSYLIEENDQLYNTGFSFEFTMPKLEVCQSTHPNDILYICILAIYQKLDEISFATL